MAGRSDDDGTVGLASFDVIARKPAIFGLQRHERFQAPRRCGFADAPQQFEVEGIARRRLIFRALEDDHCNGIGPPGSQARCALIDGVAKLSRDREHPFTGGGRDLRGTRKRA